MKFRSKNLKRKMVIGRFLILLTSIVFAAGCGGSGGSSGSGDAATGADTVTITGDFEDGNYAQNNWFNGLLPEFLSSAHAFDPSTVSKVLVFFGNGKYVTSNVSEEGGFSINVKKGAPAGMIFVGENDNYLGYLTLSNSIDSLPLHYKEKDIAKIDLETLSNTDKVVQSSANVLENKFQFTQEEKDALGFANSLFASIVRNPDVDNNGKIDFLEGKFFSLNLGYFFYGGDFLKDHKNGLTPKINPPSDVWNGFRFGIRGGANWPETIYFTGPEGTGLNSTPSAERWVFDDHTYYVSATIEDRKYPPEGRYIIDYTVESGPHTLKFNVRDQSQANTYAVLPVPTVELNSDNTIHKVTWNYRTAEEDASEVDPQAIINKIELQISGTGVQCEDYFQENRMYNTGNLPAETQEHVLKCQNLLWSKVTGITMGYEDVYGNNNAVGWVPKVNMR